MTGLNYLAFFFYDESHDEKTYIMDCALRRMSSLSLVSIKLQKS